MPSKYLHGAFVQFTDTFPRPVPRVIVFQFNPETMTHSWQPAKAAEGTPSQPSGPLAVAGSPEESFSFTLVMDANEVIADGGAGEQLATKSGVYSPLAALEMLLFPTAAPNTALVGSVSLPSNGVALDGASASKLTPPTRSVPAGILPLVLFVWGPGRIVPVRVAQLTITEQLYDSDLLNPTHAEAQIQLKVLTREELTLVLGPLGTIGRAALVYSDKLRRSLAVTNLINGAESVIGMLPV
jgi:hypothetical protein